MHQLAQQNSKLPTSETSLVTVQPVRSTPVHPLLRHCSLTPTDGLAPTHLLQQSPAVSLETPALSQTVSTQRTLELSPTPCSRTPQSQLTALPSPSEAHKQSQLHPQLFSPIKTPSLVQKIFSPTVLVFPPHHLGLFSLLTAPPLNHPSSHSLRSHHQQVLPPPQPSLLLTKARLVSALLHHLLNYQLQGTVSSLAQSQLVLLQVQHPVSRLDLMAQFHEQVQPVDQDLPTLAKLLKSPPTLSVKHHSKPLQPPLTT